MTNLAGNCARLAKAGLATGLLIGLAGCAALMPVDAPKTEVSAFSAVAAGDTMPPGWHPRPLSRFKINTRYRLVNDATGVTVIEARAEQSASALGKSLNIDPHAKPWIHWRWQVPQLIADADNHHRHLEDSPVRVIVTFDGDMNKLDVEERAIAARAKALTGQPMPYATLMYIWENKAAANTVIESAHTSRIKMIVAESGDTRSGAWLEYERNITRDFEKAFGEKPGRIRSLGIMTDTDNTGASTLAYYGDIRFTARPLHAENQR